MARTSLVLAALASAAEAGLMPVTTRSRTGDGDYDIAVVDDDRNRRWVVRAPRSPAAGAKLESELALLRHLSARAGALPFTVPEPSRTVPLPEGGRALVYPYLAGTALQPGELAPGPGLAASLGRTLAALHDLPRALIEDAGLPSYAADEYRTRRIGELDSAAGSGRVPATLLTRWETALEDVGRWRFVPSLVHGDLVAEHVIVDGESIVGLLGFGEAKVADPADDLAWVAVGADEAALESVLEAYALARADSPDRHLAYRARLAGELALVRWLNHGLATDDPVVIDDAARMLSQLAHDVGEGPLS